ncbi:MAG TPA: hypothetical protein PLJ32_08245, partial [Kiritimatiellia bacterium]|nr:hypothetical protein [Kiritimatiellia bacterium]
MTHSSRWLLVSGIGVMACCAMTVLHAQDDLEALLQDLGGQKKKAPAAAVAAPKAEEKPAEPAPAAVAAPAAEEKPAAPAPAVVAAPAAEEKPAAPAPAVV